MEGSVLLIAMLMLSPMTSRSHYVALLLPYMTLLALNFRNERTGAGRKLYLSHAHRQRRRWAGIHYL
jgi:hypothetical protein